MLAVTAATALAAYAQVMTAPAVQAPVQAPALRPSAVVTVPYMVAISYPAPGQSPPTAVASFPATDLSYSVAASPNPALPAGRGTTQGHLDMTTGVSRGVPLPNIPLKTPLTSMTITVYKAGVAVATMAFTQAMLISNSYTADIAGVPQETLRFVYTQLTTTYAH